MVMYPKNLGENISLKMWNIKNCNHTKIPKRKWRNNVMTIEPLLSNIVKHHHQITFFTDASN